MKIYNMYQANYLIKNGCVVLSCGVEGKCYIEFLQDKVFDKFMLEWKTRKH